MTETSIATFGLTVLSSHYTPSISPMSYSTESNIPESVSEYHVIREVGRGGFARVLGVRSTEDDRVFALRIVDASNEEARRRLARELAVLRRLQHSIHPNIATIYWTKVSEVEEGVRGEVAMELGAASLEKILNCRAKHKSIYSLYEIVRILKGLAEALSFLARLGVNHRDVSLNNVILGAKLDNYKLIDFGEAVDCDTRLEDIDWAGNPNFMAPELLANKGRSAVDLEKADVYSLGMIGLALCLLRPVIIGGHTSTSISTALDSLREVYYPLKGVLSSMVSVRAEDRPRFDAIAAKLASLLAVGPVASGLFDAAFLPDLDKIDFDVDTLASGDKALEHNLPTQAMLAFLASPQLLSVSSDRSGEGSKIWLEKFAEVALKLGSPEAAVAICKRLEGISLKNSDLSPVSQDDWSPDKIDSTPPRDLDSSPTHFHEILKQSSKPSIDPLKCVDPNLYFRALLFSGQPDKALLLSDRVDPSLTACALNDLGWSEKALLILNNLSTPAARIQVARALFVTDKIPNARAQLNGGLTPKGPEELAHRLCRLELDRREGIACSVELGALAAEVRDSDPYLFAAAAAAAARALLDEGRAVQARRQAESALEARPTSVALILATAKCLRSEGRFNETLALLRPGLRRYYAGVATLGATGLLAEAARSLVGRGRLDRAAETASAAVAAARNLREQLTAGGAVAFVAASKGDVRGLVAESKRLAPLFTSAGKNSASLALLLCYAAEVGGDLRRIDLAVGRAEEALFKIPHERRRFIKGFFDLALFKARLLSLRGMGREAQEKIDDAISRLPTTESFTSNNKTRHARRVRALCLIDSGQLSRGFSLLSELAESDLIARDWASLLDTRVALIKCLLRLDDPPAALEVARRLRRDVPVDFEAPLQELQAKIFEAEVLVRLRKLGEARKILASIDKKAEEAFGNNQGLHRRILNLDADAKQSELALQSL